MAVLLRKFGIFKVFISYHISYSISYLILYCINCYCRYYYDDEDVENDNEFQNYLNELSVDGSLFFHGRIGQVSVESFNSFYCICCCFFCLFYNCNFVCRNLKSLHLIGGWPTYIRIESESPILRVEMCDAHVFSLAKACEYSIACTTFGK